MLISMLSLAANTRKGMHRKELVTSLFWTNPMFP